MDGFRAIDSYEKLSFQRREFTYTELDSTFEGLIRLVIKDCFMQAVAIFFFLTSIVVGHFILAKANVRPEIARWRFHGLKSYAVLQRVEQRVAVLALFKELWIGMNASEFTVSVNRTREEEEGADEGEEFYDEQL